MKPVILREGEYSEKELSDLQQEAVFQKDVTYVQYAELFEIENPTKIMEPSFKEEQDSYGKKHSEDSTKGDWIYYPWSKTLVRSISEDLYYKLRTSRNRNIVTEEEQQILKDFPVAILGMSVGSNVAAGLTYAGMSQHIRLADFDTLETTNLNRVRARIDQIGESKTEFAARQIYEINPYADLSIFDKGLSEENLEDFFTQSPKPKLIFEIIDDFKMKIRVRMEAKKHKVPVIMLTNLGDRVLIDIERYDTDEDTELFNGKLNGLEKEILEGEVSKEDEKKYAIGIVGLENIPERVLDSVKSIGITLTGRPQLMTTINISSGLGTFLTRKIALGEKVKSGRTLVSFEDIIQS